VKTRYIFLTVFSYFFLGTLYGNASEYPPAFPEDFEKTPFMHTCAARTPSTLKVVVYHDRDFSWILRMWTRDDKNKAYDMMQRMPATKDRRAGPAVTASYIFAEGAWYDAMTLNREEARRLMKIFPRAHKGETLFIEECLFAAFSKAKRIPL
jgi:hypothetical protein